MGRPRVLLWLLCCVTVCASNVDLPLRSGSRGLTSKTSIETCEDELEFYNEALTASEARTCLGGRSRGAPSDGRRVRANGTADLKLDGVKMTANFVESSATGDQNVPNASEAAPDGAPGFALFGREVPRDAPAGERPAERAWPLLRLLVFAVSIYVLEMM